MSKVRKAKRLNIYFRQTTKAFRAARQTQVFLHINKNLPYRVYSFSRRQFESVLQKLSKNFYKSNPKAPKTSTKKRI